MANTMEKRWFPALCSCASPSWEASHGWFFWNWRDGAGVAWDRNADAWGEEWMLNPLEQIDSIDGSGSHDPFKIR